MAAASTNTVQDALIVGIDFGTTYSGVAWAFSSDPGKIRTIKNWPGNRNNLEKVATVLNYNTGPVRSRDTLPYKWGFEVKAGADTLSWFKLLLNDQTKDNNNSKSIGPSGSNGSLKGSQDKGKGKAPIKSANARAPPNPDFPRDKVSGRLNELKSTISSLPRDKRPVDLVADYLRGLHQHMISTLMAAYPRSLTEQLGKTTPIKYCLTVPAVWSDKAKALTLQAAKDAGMVEGLTEIRLISEPEAAAVYCLKVFQETQNCLNPGDLYVIADCGGGTVDLISYEIVATTPRLLVKEAVSGSGSLCGSTTLNRRFAKLVEECIGTAAFQAMTPEGRTTTLNHFEEYLKKTFSPPSPPDDDEEFEAESYYCPVPGVPNNAASGVQGNFLVLTADQMVGIFKPSFDEITTLLQEQINQAEDKRGKAVTGVLLVGGYGASEYLRQHLEDNIKSTKQTEPLKVLQPVDAWTAIVRGAVLDGLAVHESAHIRDPGVVRSMVQSRISRFSYGVSACEPFVEGVHPFNKLFYSHRYGELMCRDRMSWFITKGQEINDQEPIRVKLRATVDIDAPVDDFKLSQIIFCSSADTPPHDRDHPSVHALLNYEADTSGLSIEYFERRTSPADKEDFWLIPIDMVMRYDSAELVFSTEIRPSGRQGSVIVGKSPKVQFNDVNFQIEAPSLEEQMRTLGI